MILQSLSVLLLHLIHVSYALLPDCSCITGVDPLNIDCTADNTPSTIALLEQFLTSPDINCLSRCDSNFECQQAFSLLSEYYDGCPLGYVSQNVMRSYWDSGSCSDCIMEPLASNSMYDDCNVVMDCSSTASNIPDTVDYIAVNCSVSNANSSCSAECADAWLDVTSFARRCRESTTDNMALDKLYASDMSSSAVLCANSTDCNIEQRSYGPTGYNPNCASNVNTYYNQQAQNNTLDLASLTAQLTDVVCFYGFNPADPTSYQKVCVDLYATNETGIVSYQPGTAEESESFWSAFAFAADMDYLWVLICSTLVFFMQMGFSFLEAGAVKSINVQNILFKNMMDACIGAVMFYLFGYCVAYGDDNSPDANGFIGVEDITIESETYNAWFFQWAFAATAATIVSGAVAERCAIEAYFIYTVVISVWIYPVVVHWVWSGTGWISAFNSDPAVFGGAIDFAGSAVVHMVGGFSGLMGAWCLGPRFRRFDTESSSQFYPELMHQFEFGHNVPFQVLGTFILWFGWYGFNAGSTLAAQGAMELASKVAVTTTLAAGCGGITVCILARYFQKTWHIPRVCNGVLAALVSITASCAVVSPGSSIAIGIIGGFAYYGASNLVERMKIDDPLDAFAVHGCGGMWGVLSVGIFGTDKHVEFAGYSTDYPQGERFVTQLVLVLVVAAWTVVNAGILFMVLNAFDILKVPELFERHGIDVHEHGGSGVHLRSPYKSARAKPSDVAAAQSSADNAGAITSSASGDGATTVAGGQTSTLSTVPQGAGDGAQDDSL